MKQPNLYKNPKELIKWLKFDLKKQRKENIKKELILNIGNDDKTIIIDFEFNLVNIINKLYKNKYKTDNIEIDYKMNFDNIVFNKGADFSNSIFNNEVKFKGTQFLSQTTDNTDKSQPIKILFYNITFEKKADFSNSNFNNVDVEFSNSIFNNEVKFKGTQFLSQTTDNTDKSQPIKILFYNITFEKKADFSNSNFNNVDVEFSNSCFEYEAYFRSLKLFSDTVKNIIFDNIIFKKEVFFSKSVFENYNIEFLQSEFCGELNFSSANILKSYNSNVTFDNIKCKEKINFSLSNFYVPIAFYNSEIICSKSIFNEVTFLEKVDFDSCEFINEVNFNKTKFADINISNSSFKNAVKLNQITIGNSFIFNNIEFNDEVNLTKIIFSNRKSLLKITKDNDKNIKIKFISLINTYMEGKVNFEKVNIEKIDLKWTDIMGEFSIDINSNSESVKLENWQTARILKHEEYKKSNSIKALEYHAKEIKLYKEYLSKDIKKKFNIGKLGDIFSIYLSSFYSNNGLNWIKSLVMTILITIIFFSIFYIPSIFNLNYILNKDYLYKLVEYFIPTKYDSLIEYAKNSNVYTLKKICGIIVYFAGKIMFWYGSVQTVQSFRKFSKKE